MENMVDSKLHTAEHILWQVLKGKLSSLTTRALQFAENYCRFDFETDRELSKEDLREITKTVNELIGKGLELTIEVIPRQKAKDIVDLSLIPEKISSVRIVKIGDFSIEACAGQHVKNTSEIGDFQIIEYKKIGKSTFRIKFTIK